MIAEKETQLSRQQVRQIGLAATTLADIKAARQTLEEWQTAHPSEPIMLDVFEQLYVLEDAWQTIPSAADGDKLGDLSLLTKPFSSKR